MGRLDHDVVVDEERRKREGRRASCNRILGHYTPRRSSDRVGIRSRASSLVLKPNIIVLLSNVYQEDKCFWKPISLISCLRNSSPELDRQARDHVRYRGTGLSKVNKGTPQVQLTSLPLSISPSRRLFKARHCCYSIITNKSLRLSHAFNSIHNFFPNPHPSTNCTAFLIETPTRKPNPYHVPHLHHQTPILFLRSTPNSCQPANAKLCWNVANGRLHLLLSIFSPAYFMLAISKSGRE